MPRGNPKKQIAIRIDADLHTKLLRIVADPVTKRTRQGGMSGLIEHLLFKWLAEETQKRKAAKEAS